MYNAILINRKYLLSMVLSLHVQQIDILIGLSLDNTDEKLFL